MRVIACGSRTWEDYATIERVLQGLEPSEDVVITGGARGADQLAHEAAKRLGLDTEVYPANWDKYGKAAGGIRNEKMVALGADFVFAFWDGESRGTADMIQRAEEYGIKVAIVWSPR